MDKKITSFSFSGISLFQNCPRAYKYRYIEEITEAFTSIEAYMGTSVHASFEWAYAQLAAHAPITTADVVEQYKNLFWNSAEFAKVKIIKTNTTHVDYYDQGREYIISYMNRVFPADKSLTVELEHKFEMNLTEDIIYRGVIDRVARAQNGELLIIDYKTGKAPHPLDNLQLPSYAMYLFDKNIDRHIQLCIEDLKEQKTLTAPFYRESAKEIRSRLLQEIDKIHAAVEFSARPSALCNWCGFNHICEHAQKSNNSTQCPLCKGQLTQRTGKFGPFYGCNNFPKCRYTRPVNV